MEKLRNQCWQGRFRSFQYGSVCDRETSMILACAHRLNCSKLLQHLQTRPSLSISYPRWMLIPFHLSCVLPFTIGKFPRTMSNFQKKKFSFKTFPRAQIELNLTIVKYLSRQTRNDVNATIPQLLQPLIQQIMTYEKKANVFETTHFQQLYRICSSNIKV